MRWSDFKETNMLWDGYRNMHLCLTLLYCYECMCPAIIGSLICAVKRLKL